MAPRDSNTPLTAHDYQLLNEIFTHLKHHSLPASAEVDYISSATSAFNGDLILVKQRPQGSYCAIIADVTGHGLPSAIATIPIARTFFAMLEKGYPIDAIATELNRVLNDFLPNEMMCAATLLDYHPVTGQITLWLGGLPDGLLLSEQGDVEGRFSSLHMPLGALESNEFESQLTELQLTPQQQLLLYTDGVIEACNGPQQFGENRLLNALKTAPRNRIHAVTTALDQFVTTVTVTDDLSLLQITPTHG